MGTRYTNRVATHIDLKGNGVHVTDIEQLIMNELAKGKFVTEMVVPGFCSNALQRKVMRLQQRVGARTQGQLMFWWSSRPAIQRRVNMNCDKCGEQKTIPDSLVITRPGGAQLRYQLCRNCSDRAVLFLKAINEGVNLNAQIETNTECGGGLQSSTDGSGIAVEEKRG